jgi:hypothetical protein
VVFRRAGLVDDRSFTTKPGDGMSLTRTARARGSALLIAVSTAFITRAAEAQDAHPLLSAGDVVQGTLSGTDPAFGQMGPFRVYEFEARAGQRYRIAMRSSEFDAFLSVAVRSGPLTDILSRDDDSGGGTDALLRFRAPADGRYLIIAQSLTEREVGTYHISLDHIPEPPPARAIPIPVGSAATGTLGETSPILEDDSRYDLYSFAGTRGQRLTITMRSPDFDSYLQVLAAAAPATMLASDDDGAGNLDARVRITLPADGEYLIRANSLGPSATGAYTLELRENVSVPRETRPIRPGEPVTDTLLDEDVQLDGGQHYHDWSFQAERGQRVTITMRSGELDAYLQVGSDAGGMWRVIAEDDDGGDGTDARLELTFPEAGEYIIRARTFGSGQTGAYELLVEAG